MNAPFQAGAAAVSSPALRSFEAAWLARERDELTPLREDAMQRLLRLGLPTQRDESWRYTNLRPLAARSFTDAPRMLSGDAAPFAALSLVGGREKAATVLMVNGHPVLPTHMDAWYNGIEIMSLKELARTDSSIIAQQIQAPSDAERERWALLNTALFEDGLYLKVTRPIDTPLVILHVLSGRADSAAYPRVIVDAARGTRATIIEHFVEQSEHPPLCNSSTQITAGEGALIEHYRVFATSSQATHMDSLSVRQDRGSQCRQFTIALGGGMIRASLDAYLAAPHASLESFSLLVGHDSRHVDCVNTVFHVAPDTRSRQTSRAIASGGSRVVFDSKVVVGKGAVHADSQQSCRGLLLGSRAEIDTRPQLEIHADDVRCAHGASVGRLDPDALFYMVSRGLDRETAQSLLVYAFLADVLKDMSVPSARDAIETALIGQLPDSQTLSKFR